MINLHLLRLWARAVYRMRRRNVTLWSTTRVLYDSHDVGTWVAVEFNNN